jgi:hypothetical protein
MINAVMTAGTSKTTEPPKAHTMARKKSFEMVMVMKMMMMIVLVDGEFVYECPKKRIVSAMKA